MRIRCPHCQAEHRIPDATPRHRLACPDCGRRIGQDAIRSTTVAIKLAGDVPEEVAGYRLLDLIARGANGAVFRASAPDGSTVAVKLLAEEARTDRETIARFERESSAVQKLSHPNIIRMLDAGFAGRRHFQVMEYIEGTSLRETLAEGKTPLREVLPLLRDIARALAHAHSRGIIHRDLKPENILLTAGGTAKLTDFGIARVSGEKSKLTAAGIALGTPEYMSPEQAAGRSHEADARTDIWCLGVILYEAVTGKLPFKGKSVIDTLRRIERDPPPPIRDHAPEADAALEAVILKAMAKEPSERYAGAGALADDLDAWLAGRPVSAKPASVGILGRLFSRKKRQ